MTDAERTLEAVRVRGWRIVLLGRRAKKVYTKRWDITRDFARVAHHLRTGSNVGLICDPDNGVAALDPDSLLPWADMIDTLGQPAAAWTLTGRGRLHYFVAWEPDLPAKLTWRGEVIGEVQRGPTKPGMAALQQVVIPPSIHPDTGHRYRWLVDPVSQPVESLPGDWRAYLRGLTYAGGHR